MMVTTIKQSVYIDRIEMAVAAPGFRRKKDIINYGGN